MMDKHDFNYRDPGFYREAAIDPETREMIKILKNRGYLVIDRDQLRTLGATVSMEKRVMLHPQSPAAEFVRKDLAAALAHEFIVKGKIVPRETMLSTTRVEYRVDLRFIDRKVNPNDFDYPLYAEFKD